MPVLSQTLLIGDWLSPTGWVIAGLLLVLAVLVLIVVLRARDGRYAMRRLMGDIALGGAPVLIYARGLFVPGNELFSRAPENLREPGGGLTVTKWTNIPEAHSAADARAITAIVQLVIKANHHCVLSLRTGDPTQRAWADAGITVGPHYMALQILDACEPKLVAYRHPNAFRSLVSRDVFEAQAGNDFGLVYHGRHPTTKRAFWVIMGLGDPGTEAAANFLLSEAQTLARLTGGKPFAAIVGAEQTKGRTLPPLRMLQPKPVWWRRLLFRKDWLRLSTPPGARPTGAFTA